MDPYGLPASLLAAACGVSLDTARRWKRQGRITPIAARLAELAIAGDLGRISADWTGFTLQRGKLWTPYGFAVTPGELSAIPYRAAQLRALERELASPHQRSLF